MTVHNQCGIIIELAITNIAGCSITEVFSQGIGTSTHTFIHCSAVCSFSHTCRLLYVGAGMSHSGLATIMKHTLWTAAK